MKPIQRIHFSAVVLAVFYFISPAASAQTDLKALIPVSPEVKTGKLSNGLTYYIRKNTRPANKAELRLVVNAGSILEDDDQQGIAHFTEHMGFNGTKHFKKNELVSVLQSLGVKFGADLNASTSFDQTIYILPIPLDKKENLDKALLVLEDWASTMSFDGAEIDKERGVVLEESRLGKGAEDRMDKVIYPKLFGGSKYGERLPIGKEDILKTFKYDAARRFYHDWYRPDLMAVIVVGDIDPAEAEKDIRSHFEKLKNPAKERPRVQTTLAPRQKTEAVIVSDKEATESVLNIYYTFAAAKDQLTIGDYRESIVKNLFEAMLGDRFTEVMQKPNPPFLYGQSSLGGLVRKTEGFYSVALIGKGGLEPAINALVLEDERARRFGFIAAELERAKKDQLKAMQNYYEERDKTESGSLASELIRNFLNNEPIPGAAAEYGYYQQFMAGITLEEVNQYAASKIPAGGNKLVVLTSPEKTDFTIPSADQIIAMVDHAAQQTVTPYEEKTVAASLLTTLPTPGKITSEKENKALDFTELELSNGIKVILKSTDFKNDQVIFSGFRFGGQSLYPTEDRYNAEYAASVVGQMGVGSFTPNDLGKVLAGKSVNVTPRITALTEGISGQSSATDIETMLQLTWLYFTQPRKDDELFNSFITKQQTSYKDVMSDPQAVFQDTLLKVIYGKNPRAPKIPNVETFTKINEQRAIDIYKERFGNADGFTFLMVGKFDIKAVKPLLETYLGSLPSVPHKAAFKDLGIRPVKGVVKLDVHKGTEPKSFIRLQYTGEAPFSDLEQFRLQALIEILNIKILETLREEMSGIYGGGISGSLNKYPYPSYSITISLPCGPENVDKLIKAALNEVEKVKANGPQEADLAKVKENWKKQYVENLRNNGFWMRQLQMMAESGSNPAEILTLEKRVDALTVKELKETANRFLEGKNFIQAVLYPEK